MGGSTRTGNTTERLAVVETAVTELCKNFGSFEERMADSLKDFKGEVQELNRLYNKQEKEKAAQTPTLIQLGKCTDDLEMRMRKLEELAPAIRFAIWVGIIFGASISALIWALIIGQAQIIFK